jgi:hypothetical protein
MIDVRKMVRVAAVGILPVLIWAGMPVVRAADETPAAKAEGKAKKAPVDYRGPLPFYYAKVLSPDDKEKLYVITEKYAQEIKTLQSKLRELEEARDKELEAALTPEQRARVAELREEAAKAKTKSAKQSAAK